MAFAPRFFKHRGITVIQKLDPAVPPSDKLGPGCAERNGVSGVSSVADKVGLVLAGGAVAGGAFKAGGLRALESALVRRQSAAGAWRPFGLNDFDVFVGLSAGSVLAAVLSAGIPPDEIVRIISGTSEKYESFRVAHFMRPDLSTVPHRLAGFFARQNELFTNWLSGATNPALGGRFTIPQKLIRMVDATSRQLPTGLFDPRALADYLRRNMERARIVDDFATAARQTGRELYLTATDLNRGRLIVFGHDEPYSKVPISQAIAASCALPLWYRPMAIENPLADQPGEPARLDLADGGLMRTANVRVAVEKGCRLVVCYNPFTHIRYDRAGRSLAEHGPVAIASQSVRTMIGARLAIAKELLFHDPNVKADIVFIEPAEDDYAFFQMGALNFWSKNRAAQHGFVAVGTALDASYDLLHGVFLRHGIELRPPERAQPRTPSPARLAVEMRESRG